MNRPAEIAKIAITAIILVLAPVEYPDPEPKNTMIIADSILFKLNLICQ
jgi:hypothetical protein